MHVEKAVYPVCRVSFNKHTSRPTNGEVFIEKDIFTVGSSTLIEGSGFPDTLSAIVSPI